MTPPSSWHSDAVRKVWVDSHGDPAPVRNLLEARGGLGFPAYGSGLRPASRADDHVSGMRFAWLRDNAHVGHALLVDGQVDEASRVAAALLGALRRSRHDLVGTGRLPPRVDGDTLERPDAWTNVQNDATGYALWFVCLMASRGVLPLGQDDLDLLAEVVGHLERIEFWQNEDNGHWEEAPRLNMSSVGAVVAGLQAYAAVPHASNESLALAARLVEQGGSVLAAGLPFETPPARSAHDGAASPASAPRAFDAALLFLVEPLRVLSPDQEDQVVRRTTEELLRPIGLARYTGDSYWAPDYREAFGLGDRTRDFSEAQGTRDRLAVPGQEAQWTLFDPVLSTFWGRRHQESGDPQARALQQAHLERSLAQFVDLPGDRVALPEAYFVERGEWVPNDHVPLLWSQANLLVALDAWGRTRGRQ